jgi:hypothetical protein
MNVDRIRNTGEKIWYTFTGFLNLFKDGAARFAANSRQQFGFGIIYYFFLDNVSGARSSS